MNLYFRQGPSGMVNHPRQYFDASQALYRSLVLKGSSSTAKNILVIPDKQIGYLSFDALIAEGAFNSNVRQWQFMVKTAKIGYAYSLSSWLLPFQNRQKGAFSGFFIPESLEMNVGLPAANLERKYISSELRGAFYTSEKAKLANLKSAIEQSSVLHISTHSFPYGEDKIPALQMADGNFFLFQLGTTEKTPDLVVMSACQTADGLLATGEGILSMARGFAASGTNGTIAGLWNVNDYAAAKQMRTFYKFLRVRKDPEEALYLAKFSWINSPHSDPAELLPYF